MTIDRQFHRPRPLVAVVAVGDTGEALLLRSILENLGAAVLLHLIGTAADFLKVISQGDAAPPWLVICGHGDDNGLVFGEYAAGIDISMLQQGSLPPAAIAAHANLPGRTVVSTACQTGGAAFGLAFLAGGAAAYIAPVDQPEGADAALFVHLLFHRILCRGERAAEALRQCQAYDAGCRGFTLVP